MSSQEPTQAASIYPSPIEYRTGGFKFPLDERMTTSEAAVYLARNTETLARWRRLGQGPRWYRLSEKGRAPVFYLARDLDAYIEMIGRNDTSDSIGETTAK